MAEAEAAIQEVSQETLTGQRSLEEELQRVRKESEGFQQEIVVLRAAAAAAEAAGAAVGGASSAQAMSASRPSLSSGGGAKRISLLRATNAFSAPAE